MNYLVRLRNIYNFFIYVDKQRLFKCLDIRKESRLFSIVEAKYNYIFKMLPDIVDFRADFQIMKNDNDYFIERIGAYSNIVYCIISIGDKISDIISHRFEEKKYLDAILFDAIADQVLFNASSQFYSYIKKEASEKNLNLTYRFSPGSGQVEMRAQQYIFNAVKPKEKLGISITNGYMYRPIKTLGYVYGADKNLDPNENDHDCYYCSNKNCRFRR
jgi:hypothetical protein